MTTDYKHQYEEMKLMVEKYQDEIVPKYREMLDKAREELEQYKATGLEPADTALGCGSRVVHVQTKADRIRAMSDEEMALEASNETYCPPDFDCPKGNCYECWLEWLQQPAEEA